MARRSRHSRNLPAAFALGLLATGLAAVTATAAALQVNGTVTAIASLNVPASVIAVANDDKTVYVADAYAHEVLALDVGTDHVSVFAGDGTAGDSGDGGGALAAELGDPTALDVDRFGNVVILDESAQAFRVVAQASCSSSCPYGLPAMTAGDIYTIAGNGSQSFSRPANGTQARSTPLEGLFSYGWTGIDQFGDLVIYSASTNRDVFIVAGQSCSSTCPYGFSAMTAGDIYWVGGNDFAGNPSAGNSGNGGPATAAEFESPTGFAVDAQHDILVADGGTGEIRVIAGYGCSSSCPFGLSAMTAGDVYSLAAFNGDPQQLYLDHSGNLMIADPLNFNVGVIAAASCTSGCPYGLASLSAGHLYMLEGPSASSASVHAPLAHAATSTIGQPSGLALDPAANLFIDDASASTLDEVQMQAPAAAAPPPTPTPTPVAATPKIAIVSFSVSHSRRKATVRLTCGGAACVGEAQLTAGLKVKVLRHTTHESFLLGHASYSLAAGASAPVTFKLTAVAHAAVAHATKRHPLHATVTANVTGGTSASKTLQIR